VATAVAMPVSQRADDSSTDLLKDLSNVHITERLDLDTAWFVPLICTIEKNSLHDDQIHLSVIVMLVTGTGDEVVYRIGRSKGRSRTQTSRGGPRHGRRGDRRRVESVDTGSRYCSRQGGFTPTVSNRRNSFNVKT
jgi:hypothetical protein